MDKNSFGWHTLIIVAIAIIVGGGIVYGVKNREIEALRNENTQLRSQVSNETPDQGGAGKTAVTLDTMPISFDIPADHTALQKEGFEGGYGTTVSVGKEVRDGFLKYAPLQIEILPQPYDENRKRSYRGSEYVEAVYSEQRQSLGKPEYIELFSNKAVRYTNDADGTTVIVGYLQANQHPRIAQESMVRITSYVYGTGAEFSQELFDTAVNSLKITN